MNKRKEIPTKIKNVISFIVFKISEEYIGRKQKNTKTQKSYFKLPFPVKAQTQRHPRKYRNHIIKNLINIRSKDIFMNIEKIIKIQ